VRGGLHQVDFRRQQFVDLVEGLALVLAGQHVERLPQDALGLPQVVEDLAVLFTEFGGQLLDALEVIENLLPHVHHLAPHRLHLLPFAGQRLRSLRLGRRWSRRLRECRRFAGGRFSQDDLLRLLRRDDRGRLGRLGDG